MPSPLKIGLFARYHSEIPCRICLKQSAAYPETPQRIPRGLYHAITPQQIGKAAHHISRNRYRAIMPTAPERPDEPRRPNQPGTICQTGAAFHGQPSRIFRSSPVMGVCSRCNALLFAMQGKCFLRLFCAEFSELHQMYICGNTEKNENRVFASFLQTRGISNLFLSAISA